MPIYRLWTLWSPSLGFQHTSNMKYAGYPLWSCWSTYSSFSDIASKEYTHMSSLSSWFSSLGFQHTFNKKCTLYPLWACWYTSSSFHDISNKEYTHIYIYIYKYIYTHTHTRTLFEPLVYLLASNTYLIRNIHNILFGAAGLHPQAFEAYLIRNTFI